MTFLYVIEWLVSILVIYVLVTQILAPVLAGRPIFPRLRRQGQLEQDLAEARQQVRETELERTVKETKAKARRPKASENPPR